MTPILLLLATTFTNIQTDITPQNLPDTTVCIKFEQDSVYTKLISEKAYLTHGKSPLGESSKIRVKGTICPIKIQKNKFFDVYFRIRGDVKHAQFCMFKMDVKGTKRIASSHDLTGKKIFQINTGIRQLDPIKKVYSMQIISTLTPGVYGFAFVTINKNGHFYYNPFVSKSVYCIEITE
jgi:hypothetical protein